MILLPAQPLAESIGTALQWQPGGLTRPAVQVAVIWALATAALVLLRALARRILRQGEHGGPHALTQWEKRGRTISQLLRGVGTAVIILVALLMTLNVFIDIGPLLAGAGLLGLAVSFGAQSLVKDVISGFFLLLENQFAVGDVIEVAGKTGTVEQMSLRVVRLRDVQGVLHVVPNGQIGVVSNSTRGWGGIVIDVGVPYETEIDRTLAVVRDEAERFAADPDWAARLEGAPLVPGVESFADSAVMLRVLLRTVAGEQWGAAREFRRRLLRRFGREGIPFPFPHRTVQVVDRRSREVS